MRILKVILLSLLGLVVVAVLAGVMMGPKRMLGYLAPAIGEVRILNTQIKNEKATMDMQVDVSYRLIPAMIDSMEYSLFLYGDEVAEGNKQFPQDSRTRRNQQLTMPVEIQYKDLADKVKRHQGDSANALVKVKAYVDFPLIGQREVDLEETVQVKIPYPPDVRIVDLEVQDFGLKEVEMIMTVAIENPNDFSFSLENINYHLQIDEYITSKGVFQEPFDVVANGTSTVEVPVRTELENRLKAVFQSIKGDTDWPYTMSATMKLKPGDDKGPDSIDLEMKSSGTVNVFKVARQVADAAD